MKIEIGDKITLSEEVTDELTAAHWGERKPSCVCHTCHDTPGRKSCRKIIRGKAG